MRKNTWKKEYSYCTRLQLEGGEKEQLGDITQVKTKRYTKAHSLGLKL